MGVNDDALGMNRAISRRDFINGAIASIAGASAAGCDERSNGQPARRTSAEYPPGRSGLRGNHIRIRLRRRESNGLPAAAYSDNPLAGDGYTEGDANNVIGRRSLGRIAIANSDAGADAALDVAIDQAHRAIAEILS